MHLTTKRLPADGGRPAVTVLAFTGDFDSADQPTFTATIDAAIGAGDPGIVLDLSALKFMVSSGLGHLIKARKRVADLGGELVLVRPGKLIAKALRVLGLDVMFRIFDTAEGAIAHFRGPDAGRPATPAR